MLSIEQQARDLVQDCLYNGTTLEGAYTVLYDTFSGNDLEIALKAGEAVMGYSEDELAEIADDLEGIIIY